MTIEGRYSATHRPSFAVAAVDLLAQALAARGPIAPPNCALSCAIVAQLAPVVRSFDPPLMLELRQRANGSLTFDGAYRLGDGPLRDFPLGDGSYTAELRGDHYLPSRFQLDWPPAALRTPIVAGVPTDVGLMPSTAYPYPDVTALPFNLGPTLLRGSVFGTDGTPEVGALVSIPALPALNPPAPAWPFIQTETDASGGWALLLPDRRRFGVVGETAVPPVQPMIVHVQCQPTAGGRVLDFKNVQVTLGRENAVPNTSLRGRVTRAGGKPLGGVVITTSLNALTSRTRDDGQWSLYLDPNELSAANIAVTATAPGGGTATLNGVSVQQKAAVVVPTIHLP